MDDRLTGALRHDFFPDEPLRRLESQAVMGRRVVDMTTGRDLGVLPPTASRVLSEVRRVRRELLLRARDAAIRWENFLRQDVWDSDGDAAEAHGERMAYRAAARMLREVGR